MASLRWTVGDVEIIQLIELEAGELIQSIIKEATPTRIREIPWLAPHFADEAGSLKALVQGFLIRSGANAILVDTCNGNDKRRTDVPQWGQLQTDFLSQLSSTGTSVSDVRAVVCTHLHMDHVGWNTRWSGRIWVPTFPNADYIFSRPEYEYWSGKPAKEIADDKAAFDDSVLPIVNAGLARFVADDHNIDRSVRLIPTPGHTPGHVSVLIESRSDRAIISGDVLHHPCQIAHPTWSTDSDTFPDAATATRRRLLEELANSQTVLIGSHFANPVAGRIVRLDDGFKFQLL